MDRNAITIALTRRDREKKPYVRNTPACVSTEIQKRLQSLSAHHFLLFLFEGSLIVSSCITVLIAATMFKASLSRHARLGRVASRQLSTFSSVRPLRLQSLQSSEQQLSAARSPLQTACLRSIAARLYSSEAAAQSPRDAASDNVGSQRITKFADLPQLGVHPALVRAITEGMRYEDMTEVQSLTINPALRGTDL